MVFAARLRVPFCGDCSKAKQMFFEKLPELEVTDRNGNTRKKVRTKEHCCWPLERLLALGGELITDQAKCYQQMGDVVRCVLVDFVVLIASVDFVVLIAPHI